MESRNTEETMSGKQYLERRKQELQDLLDDLDNIPNEYKHLADREVKMRTKEIEALEAANKNGELS